MLDKTEVIPNDKPPSSKEVVANGVSGHIDDVHKPAVKFLCRPLMGQRRFPTLLFFPCTGNLVKRR